MTAPTYSMDDYLALRDEATLAGYSIGRYTSQQPDLVNRFYVSNRRFKKLGEVMLTHLTFDEAESIIRLVPAEDAARSVAQHYEDHQKWLQDHAVELDAIRQHQRAIQVIRSNIGRFGIYCPREAINGLLLERGQPQQLEPAAG